jgi:hypothetical protein
MISLYAFFHDRVLPSQKPTAVGHAKTLKNFPRIDVRSSQIYCNILGLDFEQQQEILEFNPKNFMKDTVASNDSLDYSVRHIQTSVYKNIAGSPGRAQNLIVNIGSFSASYQQCL